MTPSIAKKAIRAGIRRSLKVPLVRRSMVVALQDDENLGWVVHHLCDRTAIIDASWADDRPPELDEIAGFEDLYWLYTPSPLTQRLSRLQLDESAYLYKLVRRLGNPRVAEIGRFKGGTTFLLAAAGGSVVSIDNAAEAQAEYMPQLRDALERFGLGDRVELTVGDARAYAVAEESFDVVFLDASFTYDGMRADVEHWLPLVRRGGHLVLHTINPRSPSFAHLSGRMGGVLRLADELGERDDLDRQAAAPPSLAHFVRR